MEKKVKRDWVDLLIKAITPITAGLLIALVGFWTERTLTSIASREESARLITELQVKREQAESDLRKDVFDHALKAFLEEAADEGSITGLSRRLLKLELLALNFGDSLSLSPLFTEFRRELDNAEPVSDKDKIDHDIRIGELKKRLRGLAKKVASTQLSALAPHGKTWDIRVELPGLDADTPCEQIQYNNNEFKWPDDLVKIYVYRDVVQDGEISEEYQELIRQESRKKSLIKFDGVERSFTATFSKINHCKNKLVVDIDYNKTRTKQQGNENIEEDDRREFTLDFFNFPMVDNTRLSDNHRFAIVMEEFNIKGNQPHIILTGIIFPSEYASLRDRPGMAEAIQILNSALNQDNN